jgi:hypothetical protein
MSNAMYTCKILIVGIVFSLVTAAPAWPHFGMLIPTNYMITQTIKADGNGVFTYAIPVSGWWGFAALNSADYKLPHQGEEKDIELGAVIWVYFHEMK